MSKACTSCDYMTHTYQQVLLRDSVLGGLRGSGHVQTSDPLKTNTPFDKPLLNDSSSNSLIIQHQVSKPLFSSSLL